MDLDYMHSNLLLHTFDGSSNIKNCFQLQEMSLIRFVVTKFSSYSLSKCESDLKMVHIKMNLENDNNKLS